MNLRRELIIIASLITLSENALPSTPPPGKVPIQETDEAAIYRIALEECLSSQGDASSGSYLVVVSTTTRAFDIPANHSLTPSTLEAGLARANAVSVPIPALPPAISRPVPRRVIDEIFARKGWPEFYRRFPKSRGFIELSRPAFTDDRQKALLYVSYSCGGLCGTGWLVYLARSGASWRISRKEMLWIS